jgi:hypothetical protein
VQHLSIFDYIAVSGSLEGRRIEYVDHLHEHFVDPVVVRNGRYMPPVEPGYSIKMRPESLQSTNFLKEGLGKMNNELQIALISGPAYDPLYESLTTFTRTTGIKVNVAFSGDHPELNHHLADSSKCLMTSSRRTRNTRRRRRIFSPR